MLQGLWERYVVESLVVKQFCNPSYILSDCERCSGYENGRTCTNSGDCMNSACTCDDQFSTMDCTLGRKLFSKYIEISNRNNHFLHIQLFLMLRLLKLEVPLHLQWQQVSIPCLLIINLLEPKDLATLFPVIMLPLPHLLVKFANTSLAEESAVMDWMEVLHQLMLANTMIASPKPGRPLLALLRNWRNMLLTKLCTKDVICFGWWQEDKVS